MRARKGLVQTSAMLVWLVSRANTLENVGRNAWLYIKQYKLYNSILALILHVL
jgi:hypothetical protein